MDSISKASRLPAEEQFAHELVILRENENYPVPDGWLLSPRSVKMYILGGTVGNTIITPKYFGSERLIELCIATLLADKALLLSGPPGTAKTRLSEHLAAAVSGYSRYLVQGTMGTGEEQLKYGWNYAMLVSEGPSRRALVPSPVYTAMEKGAVVRIEELNRCPGEVQDCLISILSEKSLSIPELADILTAKRGFSLIATVNTFDQGVNAMSSALARRFNCMNVPPPPSYEEELEIVSSRATEELTRLGLKSGLTAEVIEKTVTVLRELRNGETLDRDMRFRQSGSPCSPADAISVLTASAALSSSFGDGRLAELIAQTSSRNESDRETLREYSNLVLRPRGDMWAEIARELESAVD